MLNYLQLLASMSIKHRLTCSGHHLIDLNLAPMHKLLIRSCLPVDTTVRLAQANVVDVAGQLKIGATVTQLVTDFISQVYEECSVWYSPYERGKIKEWLMSGITSDHHFTESPLPSMSYEDSAKLLGRLGELLKTTVIDPLNRHIVTRRLDIAGDVDVSDAPAIQQSRSVISNHFDTNSQKKTENSKVKDVRHTYYLNMTDFTRELYNSTITTELHVPAMASTVRYINELSQKFIPVHEQKTGMFGIDATDRRLPYRSCFFELCTLPAIFWDDLPQYSNDVRFGIHNQNIDALIELFAVVKNIILNRTSISGLNEKLTEACLNFSLKRTRPFIYE